MSLTDRHGNAVSTASRAAIERLDDAGELMLGYRADPLATIDAALAELLDVLARPRLARFIDPELRDEVLALLDALGTFFTPTEAVADCRDAKDDKYLELALAAGAGVIVSGDDDLLVLHPWRGVRVLRPADYLAEAEGRGA